MARTHFPRIFAQFFRRIFTRKPERLFADIRIFSADIRAADIRAFSTNLRLPTRGYSGLMLAVVYFIRRISLFYAPRGLEKYRKNAAFYGFLKSRARFSKAFLKALSRSLR